MAAPIDIAHIVRMLPYVHEIKHPDHRWCDGWRTIAGRKQKCQTAARYKFVESTYKPKKGRARSGNFCPYHLIMTLRHSHYEEARAERAFNKAMEALQNESRN